MSLLSGLQGVGKRSVIGLSPKVKKPRRLVTRRSNSYPSRWLGTPGCLSDCRPIFLRSPGERPIVGRTVLQIPGDRPFCRLTFPQTPGDRLFVGRHLGNHWVFERRCVDKTAGHRVLERRCVDKTAGHRVLGRRCAVTKAGRRVIRRLSDGLLGQTVGAGGGGLGDGGRRRGLFHGLDHDPGQLVVDPAPGQADVFTPSGVAADSLGFQPEAPRRSLIQASIRARAIEILDGSFGSSSSENQAASSISSRSTVRSPPA